MELFLKVVNLNVIVVQFVTEKLKDKHKHKHKIHINMKTLKIKLHSIVDLITNSSTVIFTYSEGALQSVKNLLNEMIKTFNIKDSNEKLLTADELFYFGVFLSDDRDDYINYWRENVAGINEDEDDPKDMPNIEQLIDDILTGKIEKPDWMINAEEAKTHCDYFRGDTYLFIKEKDEKYTELGNSLL